MSTITSIFFQTAAARAGNGLRKFKLRYYAEVEFYYGRRGALVVAEGAVTGRHERWLTAVTGDRCLCTVNGGLIRAWADSTPGFGVLADVARGRVSALMAMEKATKPEDRGVLYTGTV